jgi:hypothetical protein
VTITNRTSPSAMSVSNAASGASVGSIRASTRCVVCTTRFVTGGGIDLRGPEVVHTTQRVLARIEPTEAPLAAFDTDMADGLVLLVIVTGSRRAASWRASQAMSDPTITRVLVTTNEVPTGVRLTVPARSDEEFVTAWQSLVGRPRTTPVPATTVHA